MTWREKIRNTTAPIAQMAARSTSSKQTFIRESVRAVEGRYRRCNALDSSTLSGCAVTVAETARQQDRDDDDLQVWPDRTFAFSRG